MTSMDPVTPLDGDVEMFTRGKMQSLFTIDTSLANRVSLLSIVQEVDTPTNPDKEMKHPMARPVSEITEILDEDDMSDFEEYSDEALSFVSNEGRRSQSTISTFDEVPTPQSSRRLTFLAFENRKSVEGPRGPHLFRSSTASDYSLDFALQLSPLFPKKLDLRIDTTISDEYIDGTPTTIADAPAAFAASEDEWDKNEPTLWTTNQVSLWMYQSGVDSAVIEKFEDNDISGRVLLDLQFEDLKDIGIESFGKRHEVWDRICSLRAGDGRISPVPTPFQDTSPRNSHSSRGSINYREPVCEEPFTPITPGGGRRRRRKYRANPNDPITPMDSVSIVAIEQLIPKPHKCAKGENCSKWKKQQKWMKRLHEEHGFPISPENGGHIFMAGDPGNAFTARNFVENVHRPMSDAEPSVIGPSVVASSDVMGPGEMPMVAALQEGSLKQLEERDAQENVKNFLSFQHVNSPQIFVPDSPLEAFQQETFEMFPAAQAAQNYSNPLSSLQNLPRLQIPRTSTTGSSYDNHTGTLAAIQDPFSAMSACRTALPSPGGLYRFATPASEMDVPLTAIPHGPVSRDTSQSVPPDMLYRDPSLLNSARPQDWRRPSFQLPSLHENEIFTPKTSSDNSRRTSNQTMHDLSAIKEKVKLTSPEDYEKQMDPRFPGVNHAGWMKKRKTRMLRHEWNEHHFRLAGNQLDMHQNDIPQSAVLESLNIDDYAIACSSLASNKLAAKFKALKIAREKGAIKDSAFEFQLVPDQMAKHSKSHHFAVKTRDERIDWMRELMLAKALRAKKDGFDVEVNGRGV